MKGKSDDTKDSLYEVFECIIKSTL